MPSDRADAHIHLFEQAYRGLFTGRPGVRIDEAACYASLMKDHGISIALVIGYALEPWCVENNAHLVRMRREHTWVRPLAFVHLDRPALDIRQLETWQAEGFVGLSFYIFSPDHASALGRIESSVWSWLIKHRWLISCNSRGANWQRWKPVLREHPDLRLLISHLGLPPRVSVAPSIEQAREALADVLALAEYPNVHVKLSGFYALSDPGSDYPHVSAWPYVHVLLERFGATRLLWASDFSPCLEDLSFPQTLGVIDRLPFLSSAIRRGVMGANLLRLLNE